MSHASAVQGKDGRGKDTGNGRLIVSKLEANGSDCVWATQKLIEVPKTADFKDYSDMDIHGDKGPISRIAITSQVGFPPRPRVLQWRAVFGAYPGRLRLLASQRWRGRAA